MSLSTLSIKRPVLAIVLNLLIVIFGVIAYQSLGVREFPSIDPPVVNVRTSYPGANADIVEAQITVPLEKALNGIEGVRTISSGSNQGSSNITIEFQLGVDMERAANDVRDKVSQAVRNLPNDLDGLPVVSKADSDSDAILAMSLKNNDLDVVTISDYAENVLAPRFQNITGVSDIQLWGLKRMSMRLWMNPDKMAAYGITTQDIKVALDRENVELPSGKIEGKSTELTVKTTGKFTSEEDFNNLIIKSDPERIIMFKDLGFAAIEAENQQTILRIDNEPMVGLAIQPQPGSNYIEISEAVNARIDEVKKELPSGYEIGKIFDNTDFVKQSIFEVKETLLIAVGLVVIIIFLFFRDWIIAIRPLIDIPVSLIGTFFVMYLMGFSINVLTLLAIVLATGLVVDDGIVVTENIFKKIEEGYSPIQAAIKGSNEILFAILSTSITLAAVFLPVIFMEGFVGKLFREFGIVLATAVLISAFVSLTLTPMLNAYLVRKKEKPNRFYEATEPFFKNMEINYEKGLIGFVKRKWVAIPILGVTLAMVYIFGKPLQSELAPVEDRGALRLNMSTPEGSSFDYMDRYVLEATEKVKASIGETRDMLTVTAPGFSGSGAPNTAFGRILLVDKADREKSQTEVSNEVNALFKSLNNGKAFASEQQTISVNRRGGLPLQYIIQAPNFEKLSEYLPKFMDKVSDDPTFPLSDVNLKFSKPEIAVNIDRAKAKSMGVSVADVAQTMQLAFAGQRFGYFNQNGRQYSVIGQFESVNRDEPLDLKSLYVKNNQGDLIQLDNFVRADEQSSPPQLYHHNQYMSATVSAGLAPGKTIGDGIAAMDAIKESLGDETIKSDLSGDARDFAESSSNTLFSFFLALLLVYLILAAQFESFIDPFVIMLTVPLALAGAIFSLWLFDQTLNIFSQIGIIMLIGLVTKNGILIVEFANQLRESGVDKVEAAIKAAKLRLRPILMTTLATVLGASPIALSLGAAGGSRQAMGIVVMGGLLFSLVLTLYVIPAMYILLSRKKTFRVRKEIESMEFEEAKAH